MTQWKSLSGTTALLLILTGAAQAEVTGAEVWNNWKAAAESMSQTLTAGSETQDGDTLTIRDLKIAMEVPEMTMSGEIGMIEFRDRDDGTVTITISPTYDMQFSVAPETGEKVDAALQVTQSGMSMVASGGDGSVTYDFLAPEISMSVTSLTVDGEPIDVSILLVASDVDGKYQVTEGEMTEVASQLGAASFTLDVNATEPGGSGTFAMDATFADVVANSDGSMVMMGSMQDMPAMLAAGFASSGDFGYGASTFAVDFQDDTDSFAMSGKADTGMFAVSLDADALSYEIGHTGLAFTVSGSDIPLPEIAASFARIGTAFQMPLSVSDTPQDFGMNVTLDGISVSEMIWGMADPGGALPHDPATLIVDLKGKANWLINIMDPEAAAEMDDQMPAEIHALDLNELRVAFAGAELTGTGGFTFDNSNLTTFGGIPAPTGSIDLKLVGGNGLLDTLVAMGLLPEDQAMGARMMMGMFARPGDGVDTLTSKIEVTGDGAISANGQRLQ